MVGQVKGGFSMIVSTQNPNVTADISIVNGALEIAFSDPSFVRSDMILLHGSNEGLVAVHHEGYHCIQMTRHDLDLDVLAEFEHASLKSELPSGSVFQLTAPIRVA